MNGLVIGRYQPFHLGHLEVVKEMARECDDAIIGIGSAQHSYTLENPFTAGERVMMIASALRASGIGNYHIIPIEDINRNNMWAAHVQTLVPDFEVVYANNPLTKTLFGKAGFRIKNVKLYNRKEYSGTVIRDNILKRKPWKHLVHPAVAKVIKGIDGENRIRILAGKDE